MNNPPIIVKDTEDDSAAAAAADASAARPSDSRVSEKPPSSAILQDSQEDVAMADRKDEASHHPTAMIEDDPASPATVFRIRLNQPRSNLRHKMSVPELCRNFSAVAWCGRLNAIACASETCARIPSSTANPPFWIPIHIVNPERPTECAVFNVTADSPRDSVQFIEWSPPSCSRALLIANFHGRITIWTQPSQGPVNLVRDSTCWQCEYEWRQDMAVVTKWLSGISPYRWVSSNAGNLANSKSSFEEKFLTQQPKTSDPSKFSTALSARWPSFLCVCSVFSSGSVQLHWSQWPPTQGDAPSKWFSTSKGLLGAGPSGITAADAIITEAGTLHVAGVPIVNPSTVVVWEVTSGSGTSLQATPKTNTSTGVPPSLNPPCWTGFAPLAAYLFSWQEYLASGGKQGTNQADQELNETVSLHCSPVSNFSAYVSPEAAAQSAATTTWGSGVTAVSFDPTRGGSVIAVAIVEGQYMSPYDPDEGPSITGWRVQCWESSLQPVVLHPIFGSPAAGFGGQPPMQTVWLSRVNKSIPIMGDGKCPPPCAAAATLSDERNSSEPGFDKAKLSFDPFDLPSDPRMLAQIVYSPHGGEVAVAFLRGGVHIFSGANFAPVDTYHVNVGSTISAPAFSSTGCCLASVWHDTNKDRTILKIIRVLPPAIPSSQPKVNTASWERAIADRMSNAFTGFGGVFWLGLIGGMLLAVHRVLRRMELSLDRIKCRLLEGTNAQDVRALVLDMQARLLLDMLGKGIEAALVNPATLIPEPWQASSETIVSIDTDSMIVEPALVTSIQPATSRMVRNIGIGRRIGLLRKRIRYGCIILTLKMSAKVTEGGFGKKTSSYKITPRGRPTSKASLGPCLAPLQKDFAAGTCKTTLVNPWFSDKTIYFGLLTQSYDEISLMPHFQEITPNHEENPQSKILIVKNLSPHFTEQMNYLKLMNDANLLTLDSESLIAFTLASTTPASVAQCLRTKFLVMLTRSQMYFNVMSNKSNTNLLQSPSSSTGVPPVNFVTQAIVIQSRLSSGFNKLQVALQAYVDAVLDLASHFITRLRRYASFCRTLASHAVGPSAGASNPRNMVASPTHSSASPATGQAGQTGAASSTGSSQMQAWVQGAIAKISSNADGVTSSTPNPISGPAPFMPISINTGTFPGTPAVRLIGDCHFLHRLCQLLLFCLVFRKKQLPRHMANAQRNADPNMQKPQAIPSTKVEEMSGVMTRTAQGMVRPDEGQGRTGQLVPGAKGLEEGPAGRSTRVGSGNAGQGYTPEEVRVLFSILVELCRRTSSLPHPLPGSQVNSNSIIIRLHYIDGNYTVLPEVVEAALGPHMQYMPRPRGADAAGLLLRELELHPPAEEWHRRNMYGGPWSDPDDLGVMDETLKSKMSGSSEPFEFNSSEDYDSYYGAQGLWPRKRRLSERDAAFGCKTSVGLGAYMGIMGSRRDVVTAIWKTGLDGIWYKGDIISRSRTPIYIPSFMQCIRCLRQTSAFASTGATSMVDQQVDLWLPNVWWKLGAGCLKVYVPAPHVWAAYSSSFSVYNMIQLRIGKRRQQKRSL
ncbi:hypothetical protein ACLOJK_024568 [Asimina triloba]